MLNIVVCIKQVPLVTQLPWDPQTGNLKRADVDGMLNPACRHALEAALYLAQDGTITVISMGPPMATEVLFEAAALGADRCLMLSDPAMAGSDTLATSAVLARAIEIYCPDFDLVLCGGHTTDSETAQVGPQLAEELGIPSIAMAEDLAPLEGMIRARRLADGFLETLEMDLPGLVSVSTRSNRPRYTPLGGIQRAFDSPDILTIGADELGIAADSIGQGGSPTRIVDVHPQRANKDNIVLTGTPRKIVAELFGRFEDCLGGAIGQDLKAGDA